MIWKAKLKDYIGILYYRHGLFCASHPIWCLFLVFSVVFLCCYPLKNLQSFSSSLEQYKQSIEGFDGLEANSDFKEFVEFERIADRPAWYTRVPIAYIQRIVVKSIINIPKLENLTNTQSLKLFLIDTFRTPLSQLFEINEFIRNFQFEESSKKKSLIGDLCVHVGELSKDDKLSANDKKQFNKHFLPEFNCLYLSPANFWSNDIDQFKNDDDLMQTINDSPIDLNNLNYEPNDDEDKTWSNLFLNLVNYITDKNFLDKNKFTSLRELIFGVSWSSTLRSLNEDLKLKKLNDESNKNSKSIVMSYAITIALKSYDKSFLNELKHKLNAKFNFITSSGASLEQEDEGELDNLDEFIYNLQYVRQSFVYYIPYILLYFLLFLYIYISVRKIELVKSKWGLAFAAVAQVIASLLMSIGICSYFGLTPTLNGGEIFPYLIILIGFENIVVLTKSVVSTPFDLDVRYRIALGLKKESWLITKILTFELIIIFFGIITMVPAIQEFCVFAYVGLLIDFFMQIVFFVTVLSIDIRRMELTDLHKKVINNYRTENKAMNNNVPNDSINNIDKNDSIYYRGNNLTIDSKLPNMSTSSANLNHHHSHKNGREKYKNFFANKSVQFFYFWARTRLVQRAIILLSMLWIILIFYKSLLVVELMRYDVNVKKETVEALLPKGVGFPKLLKDNFQQLLFTSTNSILSNEKSQNKKSIIEASSSISTVDYLKRHFQNFMIMTTMNSKISQAKKTIGLASSKQTTTKSTYNSFEYKKFYLSDEHDWQSLSYYHWLTLFSYYNVSLYNRYVSILPQINLYKLITDSDILKHRNQNEIKKYNSIVTLDNEYKFVLENLNDSNNKIQQQEFESKLDDVTNLIGISFKTAVFELIGIVILGIPTIILIVYCFILLYKFLCSKNYEQWRKSWSTSNIKRQYKIIHSKLKRKEELTDFRSDSDEGELFRKNRKKNLSDYYDSDVEDSSNSNEQEEDDGYFSLKRKSSSNSETFINSNANKDDLINKIINGQKDDIDLTPFKLINSLDDMNNSSFKHDYPLDLITIGSNLFVTSDLSNSIKIWSLAPYETDTSSDLIKTIGFNQNEVSSSVWSICLTDDDKFVLIGQSDGILKIVDILTNNIIDYKDKNISGITNVVHLKSKLKQTESFLINQNKMLNILNTKSHEFYYIFLLVRLNGFLELIQFSENKINLLYNLKTHNTPITNVSYVNGGDYLLTTGQDYSLKVIKINLPKANVYSSDTNLDSFYQNNDKELRIMFDLNEHGISLITTMCIDKENSINAATGSEDGLICLWNLFTGECKFKLKSKSSSSSSNTNNNNKSIIRLELSQNFLISLNIEQQMCIWNRQNGKLIKEFKFLSPLSKKSLEIDNSNNLNANKSFFNLFNKIFLNKAKINNLMVNTDDLVFQPNPTMCLYSRNILVTGGCSCIYLWNIVKGELIKKINIKKFKNTANSNKSKLDNYSQVNFIKEIKIINQEENNSYYKNINTLTINRLMNKLLLVTDYNDSIYILKIPFSIVQNFD